MGWKSTTTIARDEALKLIMSRLLNCSNGELSEALEALGFGENNELPYYGYNFMISDEGDQQSELNFT